ncbi:VOC family protein [Roseospirillum parvum]|uniref:Glyoxalase/Bleomycin resistance protein/Dioxygenase superfamily protein n=1 Tax=Roseospirillum parvum TaxID=83401 RepID=A0A1G7U0V2_9PROT|nr:VOC family protein [Roseospirillum parvum]SDG40964.1 Glyoxalase/Bleomycin resistance protein/Dioxygenase superfamily protein [Roseospirillum parvum]
MEGRRLSVTLATDDMAAARAFYQDLLDGRPVFDCGWYVVLRLPSGGEICEVCLMQPQDAAMAPTRGATLNLRVADADRAHAALVGRGAEPVMPLGDHPWGDRGFGILDPGGNMVYLYHPIPPSPDFAGYFTDPAYLAETAGG